MQRRTIMTHSRITKTVFQISARKKSKTAMLVTSIGLLLGVSLLPGKVSADESDLTYIEEFGKRLFFENISDPKRQSCASCHHPGAGGTNGVSGVNLKQVAVTGANPHTVGALKPPTNKYVQFITEDGEVQGLPNFNNTCGRFPTGICGGAFWNGRAKGDSTLDMNLFMDDHYAELYSKYRGPVTDQAHASPFINPVEQGHKNKVAVCQQIAKTKWGAELYDYTWGLKLSCNEKTIDEVFARFAVSLGAWQMSYENNPYDSKRDLALKSDKDGKFPLDSFTDEENLGHDLFYGVAENRDDLGFGQGRCGFCHRSGNRSGTSEHERYTDDSYHNIGTPRNYEIPGSPEADDGLHATTLGTDMENPLHMGSHKTPTLRNTDLRLGKGFTKAYGHNGYFKSLKSIVHFYNTAIAKDRCEDLGIMEATEKEALANNCWPTPEHEDTSALGFIGDLKLTDKDEDAIVAYLMTLSDTSIVKQPKPYKSQKYDESRLSRD
ncbi:methylamine utilization protein [Photobacterium sp. SDRW27]|uniref:cytochrome-c peroxidase n=1 Tax=Photobacterium obscurum TaxID=2829490 RepID=UPI002243C0C7|nr:cytochrome c peroxidase [Photobacterium obscurum]MCW8327939.1 methylamine utilization protein [Photobacterium obscurum]